MSDPLEHGEVQLDVVTDNQIAYAVRQDEPQQNYIHEDVVRAQIESAVKRALEGAAEVCRKQAEVFGSDGYAVGQPMASFLERFACKECGDAIRALDPAQFVEGETND